MGPREIIAAVIHDTRLSSEARVVTLHIASLGDGEHELDYDDLRRLLNQAGEKRIRQAVKDAADVGWISWREGGRGHSPIVEFNPAEDSPAETADLKDSPANSAGLNEPGATDRPAQAAGLKDRPAEAADLKGAAADATHARDQGAQEVDVDVDVDVVGGAISPRAEEALEQHNALLAGCRGALRDYLGARVEPGDQFGYIQTLATWLNGFGFNWMRKDGSRAPPEERPGLIAAALNELMAQRGGEKKMKRAQGDILNLRTKLGIIVKQAGGDDGNHRGGTASSRGAEGASQSEAAEAYGHLG